MVVVTSLVLLLCCIIISLAGFRYLVCHALLSPLAKIPAAHWSATFSSAWIKYHRNVGKGTSKVHDAHKKYGPIIRLAPNEISVNRIDGGVRAIYAGGYEKKNYYDVFKAFGYQNMFSMDDNASHTGRKRMVRAPYTKSSLYASSSFVTIREAIIDGRLLPLLESSEQEGTPIDLAHLLSATTMDIGSAYMTGLKRSTNFLSNLAYAHSFNNAYNGLHKGLLWCRELQLLTSILSRCRLDWLYHTPKFDAEHVKADELALKMCDKAEITIRELTRQSPSTDSYPTVYAHLRSGFIKARSRRDPSMSEDELAQTFHMELASEMFDHITANYVTTSIVLAFLAWQLSKAENLHWRNKLYTESISAGDRPRDIDNLPILNAILMETLRLNTAIPEHQPRVTPANAKLGSYGNLPRGIRVQAQAYSLHRNEAVFPDSESWLPERWLNANAEQRKEMNRWFWAFGSGSRMCLGKELAILEMKAIVKAVWISFRTTIIDDRVMRADGISAAPFGIFGGSGDVLLIKLEKRAGIN